MWGWKITPFRHTWVRCFYLGPFVDWESTSALGVDFEVGIDLGPWIFGLRIQGPDPDLADRMVEALKS